MNPTVDNDLQKAIDDITKNTNIDPVFAEPVAAPVAEPAKAPVTMAAPTMPKVPPMPKAPAAMSPKAPAMLPIAPAPKPVAPIAPVAPVAPMPAAAPIATPTLNTTPKMENTMNPDMQELKNAALRDLAPIMDKVDMDPAKKFGLYKNIHDELHDNSVIAPAYETAKTIADDRERADALLYLIDSIDNL